MFREIVSKISEGVQTGLRSDAPEARSDGSLVNVITGLGTSKDQSAYTRVGNPSLLDQTSLERLYSYGLPRRYVDAVANEVLRHKTTIKLAGDVEPQKSAELINSFNRYLQDSQFFFKLTEVIKLQRLYGGAALVLLIDDGLPPEEPVDVSRIRAVNDYIPLSRYELVPMDVTFTDYSKPEYYLITTSQRLTADQQESYVNLKIHHSRVARFDGLYLPWNSRSNNKGWGQSVLASFWEAYKRYESALGGLEHIAKDSDIFTHKIPGLFQRIAAGNEADLKKRLEANNLSRSMYGGLVIDTEEEVEFLNRNLANLAGALDPFVKNLQAVTGWPSTILMGESPGGLGKEGRYEERVWASIVEEWQENYLRTPITEIFQYLLLSKYGPTGGRNPEAWTVEFPSVFTQTDEEKTALRVQMAQTDAQYIQLGVLNSIEVRTSRFGTTEYSIETELNEAVTQQMAMTADAQFQSQMMGYEAQNQAYSQEQSPAPKEGAAPQGESPSDDGAAKQKPDDAQKTDSFELYEAQGLRIRVSHKFDDGISIGYLVGPDGQRTDTSAAAPLMIFGPHRTKARKLYRARFDLDGELIDGPFVAGFASLRAAKQGLSVAYPRQNVAGLSPISSGETEALRAGWDAY